MANLPHSFSVSVGGFGGGASSSSCGTRASVNKDRKMQSVEKLVLDLINPDLRGNALLELSKGEADSRGRFNLEVGSYSEKEIDLAHDRRLICSVQIAIAEGVLFVMGGGKVMSKRCRGFRSFSNNLEFAGIKVQLIYT